MPALLNSIWSLSIFHAISLLMNKPIGASPRRDDDDGIISTCSILYGVGNILSKKGGNIYGVGNIIYRKRGGTLRGLRINREI